MLEGRNKSVAGTTYRELKILVQRIIQSGYFDWKPGTISIQYNNYSGNRFHSSERAKGTGEFLNGSLSIAWSKSW